MKKAAFLSYNAIAGFNAGWYDGNDCKVLVIPNSKGQLFAAVLSGESGNRIVTNEINDLWKKLGEVITEIDYVVVYVGTDGSEIAIELASKLPADKVVYVLCDCGLSDKQRMIKSAGHELARQIICECRGLQTMSRLCKSFLQTGIVG